MADGNPGVVDWEGVEEELNGIDEGWKQAKFDSLPHVVEVLLSKDPDHAVAALKDQRDAIEEQIDEVVRGYHDGFHKAIHNNSQILRLFSESSAKMSGLKSNLAETKKMLSSRHSQLQQQWYRSVMLRQMIQILDQIDNVAKVPGRIEKLVNEKRYYAAVQLHLSSCAMLEREGLQGVGALKEVRGELAKWRNNLFMKVVEDLNLHLYNRGEYSMKKSGDDDFDEMPIVSLARGTKNGMPGAGSGRLSWTGGEGRPRSFSGGLDKLRSAGSFDMSGGLMRQGSGSGDIGVLRSDGVANDTGHSGDGIRMGSVSTALPPWLKESTPNEFTEMLSKSKYPDPIKYLQTMVECLSLFGKVSTAGSMLSEKLRLEIRELIASVVEAKVTALDAARPRVDQMASQINVRSGGSALGLRAGGLLLSSGLGNQSKAKTRGKSSGLLGPKNATSRAACLFGVPTVEGSFVHPLEAALGAAEELLESVFAACLRVLENHVIVGETMEAKLHAGGVQMQGSGVLMKNQPEEEERQPSGGYSVAFVWSCLQSELQQLLCDILRVSPDASQLGGGGEEGGQVGGGDIQKERRGSGGVLQRRRGRENSVRGSEDGGMNGTADDDGGLSFAFRFMDMSLALSGGKDGASGVTQMGIGKGSRRGVLGAAVDGFGTAAALPERGIYLTSAVYRPLLEFSAKAASVLPTRYLNALKEGNSQGRRTSKGGTGSIEGLRTFMEVYVRETYLPRVRMDYQGKLADALSSPAALRPRAKSLRAYEKDVGKGRAILQAVLLAESLISEVLLWGSTMPIFAAEFVELAVEMLDRVLERCRSTYMDAVMGSLSRSLVVKPELENLMVKEDAYAVVDDSASGNLDDEGEREVKEVEVELLNLFQSMRPVNGEQLIAESQKVVLIAALSDSLEYLADAIDSLVFGGVNAVNGGGAIGGTSPVRRRGAFMGASAMGMGNVRGNGGVTPQQAVVQQALMMTIATGQGQVMTGQPGPMAKVPRSKQMKRSASALSAGPVSAVAALSVLSSDCRAMSTECMRLLRVEMQLQCLHHVGSMWEHGYMRDDAVEEPEDYVVALSSLVTQLDEEIGPHLPVLKRGYVFGSVCKLASCMMIRCVNDMKAINSYGVRQVTRNCIALQQALSTLGGMCSMHALEGWAGARGIATAEEVQGWFDHVRTYYELLNLPSEALFAFIEEHPHLYSLSEYSSLLTVNVPGRDVPEDALQRAAHLCSPA